MTINYLLVLEISLNNNIPINYYNIIIPIIQKIVSLLHSIRWFVAYKYIILL